MPRARHAGGSEHRLHLRLVPEVVRRRDVDSLDFQVLANLREWHLQLLEHSDETLHRSDLPAESLHGSGDLPRVERIVDSPMPGEVLTQSHRQPVGWFVGDQRKFDTG